MVLLFSKIQKPKLLTIKPIEMKKEKMRRKTQEKYF